MFNVSKGAGLTLSRYTKLKKYVNICF